MDKMHARKNDFEKETFSKKPTSEKLRHTLGGCDINAFEGIEDVRVSDLPRRLILGWGLQRGVDKKRGNKAGKRESQVKMTFPSPHPPHPPPTSPPSPLLRFPYFFSAQHTTCCNASDTRPSGTPSVWPPCDACTCVTLVSAWADHVRSSMSWASASVMSMSCSWPSALRIDRVCQAVRRWGKEGREEKVERRREEKGGKGGKNEEEDAITNKNKKRAN